MQDEYLHRYDDCLWCADCGGLKTFEFWFATDFERWFFCLGCGNPQSVRFSRAMSEAV